MATSHAQRWRPLWMAEVQAEPPQCVMAGTDNAVDGASAIFQYWQNFWREVDAGRPPLQDQVAAALGGIPDYACFPVDLPYGYPTHGHGTG